MKVERLTEIKKVLDRAGEMPDELTRNLHEWFRVELTYTSNALEGNTLTRRETAMVVEKGITVGGKSLVEHLEATNHAQAFDWIAEKSRKPLKHFNEKDLPNFFGSGYSCVKGFTDRLMHQFEDNVLNLRIRMPIVGYDNQRNFVTKIKTYAKVISVPNSMTVLPEILPIALDLMGKGVTGTINMTNPGAISHNEILELYRKHVDPTFTWTNFTIEEQNKILAAERSNNTLDTSRSSSNRDGRSRDNSMRSGYNRLRSVLVRPSTLSTLTTRVISRSIKSRNRGRRLKN